VTWKNRIVGHGEQAASQFMANPLNWRIHPKAQREALTGVLGEVGWVQSVIVNRITGNVVDGHARIEEALKLGDETPVPFVEVDLSEEEEKQVLLTLDPISAMAAADKANLDALLHDVSSASAGVQSMLAELAEKSGLEYGAKIGGELEVTGDEISLDLALNTQDQSFPTDNEFGIPCLLPQGDLGGMPEPCERWGRYARGSSNPGSLHFYTDDARFETIWQKPKWIVESGVKAITEPNVSTYPGQPLAIVLWGIYRKRWLSRWAQQYGVFVFVDLNVESMFHEYNLLGVPKGWKHYSTRSYDSLPETVEEDYKCAANHAGTDDIVFAVFGGGLKTRKKCLERKWIHIPQENHAVEHRYD